MFCPTILSGEYVDEISMDFIPKNNNKSTDPVLIQPSSDPLAQPSRKLCRKKFTPDHESTDSVLHQPTSDPLADENRKVYKKKFTPDPAGETSSFSIKMENDSSDNADISYILEQRLSAIEKGLENLKLLKRIQKEVSIIKVIVLNSERYQHNKETYDVKFPIDNLSALENELNDTNFKEYMKQAIYHFKPVDGKNFVSSGLAKIFGDKEISKYNWNGTKDKLKFSDLTNINEVLFESWRGDYITNHIEYVRIIRQHFLAARSRRNKMNYDRRHGNNVKVVYTQNLD